MSLHSTVIGGGSPEYVFLHGLFGQGRNWSTIAKALEPATSLLIDLPNHGSSHRTPAVDLVADAAAVGEVLGSEGAAERPVTLVGHSLGGKVAMLLALARPELVRRLVVVDISPRPGIAEDEFQGYVRALRGLDLANLQSRAQADAALAVAVPNERVRSFLLSNLRREADGWRWLVNLELLDSELAALGDWPGTAGQSYPGPVLWVAGEHSAYVRTEDGPAMRSYFPRTQLLRIKGAGHWVHSDAPEALVAALKAFVAAT